MLRLPSEVLMGLASFCGQKALLALSLTCRSLRALYGPDLDRNIVVKNGDQLFRLLGAACDCATRADAHLFDRSARPKRRASCSDSDPTLTPPPPPTTTTGESANLDNAVRERYARVQSLTIKPRPPHAEAQLVDLDELAKMWLQKTRAKYQGRKKTLLYNSSYNFFLIDPLLFALRLLPTLNRLQIYDPDLIFVQDTIDGLAAWAPALKTLHLYQGIVDAGLIVILLQRCPMLEELEVGGLAFGEEAGELRRLAIAERIRPRGPPERFPMRFLRGDDDLANELVKHPHLRHFASDRSEMGVQDVSPHGLLLETIATLFDDTKEGLSSATTIDWNLESLDLRDLDCRGDSVLRFLSSRASAKLTQLTLILLDEDPTLVEEGNRTLLSSLWDQACQQRYNHPCFFEATGEVSLSCNRGLLPQAFFRRVGSRITALHIDDSEDVHEWEGTQARGDPYDDPIVLSLRDGLLPRLKKLTMRGCQGRGDNEASLYYLECLRAELMQQKPGVHFCSHDEDIVAFDNYKRQNGWDQDDEDAASADENDLSQLDGLCIDESDSGDDAEFADHDLDMYFSQV